MNANFDWSEFNKTEESREFVKFEEDVARNLTFEENNPKISESKFNNKPVYTFKVLEGEIKLLVSIQSKRLMGKLAHFVPLKDKTLRITRVGSGMDTNYNVLEIKQL